jgi:hypothetical protein
MKTAKTRAWEEKCFADVVEFVQAHPRLEMIDEYRKIAVKGHTGTVIGRVRVASLAHVKDFRVSLLQFMSLRDSGRTYNVDDPRRVRK